MTTAKQRLEEFRTADELRCLDLYRAERSPGTSRRMERIFNRRFNVDTPENRASRYVEAVAIPGTPAETYLRACGIEEKQP